MLILLFTFIPFLIIVINFNINLGIYWNLYIQPSLHNIHLYGILYIPVFSVTLFYFLYEFLYLCIFIGENMI